MWSVHLSLLIVLLRTEWIMISHYQNKWEPFNRNKKCTNDRYGQTEENYTECQTRKPSTTNKIKFISVIFTSIVMVNIS